MKAKMKRRFVLCMGAILLTGTLAAQTPVPEWQAGVDKVKSLVKDNPDQASEEAGELLKGKNKKNVELVTSIARVYLDAGKLTEAEAYLEKARKAVLAAGAELTAARKEAAAVLEQRIQSELRDLDMHKVRFAIDFGEKEPGPDGCDAVRFLMSANTGEDLKPIARIASGGELARIMLALKNVLAEDDGIDSLVFDEVDTGVSGRAAQKVAEKLAQVSRRKQVLCVTHLPQLAAMADTHFSVEKGESKGRTFTHVILLDREARKAELKALGVFDDVYTVSVRDNDRCEELFDALSRYAVEGPHYFDDDAYTDMPEKELVAEVIREKALLYMRDEIPHGIAVVVERFKERPGTDLVDIDVNIYCERESHKGMVIGKGGAMLKKIASAARTDCEEFLGCRVNLQCWVKVKADWRDNEFMLNNFGFKQQPNR